MMKTTLHKRLALGVHVPACTAGNQRVAVGSGVGVDEGSGVGVDVADGRKVAVGGDRVKVGGMAVVAAVGAQLASRQQRIIEQISRIGHSFGFYIEYPKPGWFGSPQAVAHNVAGTRQWRNDAHQAHGSQTRFGFLEVAPSFE